MPDRTSEVSIGRGGRVTGSILILVTLLSWSSVPLFLKHLTGSIDGWTANGWRYAISALFWSPVLYVALRRGRVPRRIWRAAVLPASVNVIAQSAFAWAPYYINPGLITFMLRFQILFLGLGAYWLFPVERGVLRSPRYWCGVGLVLSGLVAVCLLGSELPRGATAFGIGLALTSGLFYAGYSLSVRHYMQGVHSVLAFAVISKYTALAVVALMLIFGRERGTVVWTLPAREVVIVVISAMIGIAISHVLYYAAMARLGVSIAAGVILLQPFLTSFGSSLLYGERLTMAQWGGGVVAMLGASLMLATQGRLGHGLPVRTLPDAAVKGVGSD